MLSPGKASLRASLSSTLRLPKSSLPPRPPLPSPSLRRCTDDFYTWQYSQKDRQSFVLHDGPPYANGSLHLGHALNKILKDIICRFQISQGKRVQYIPGWDCHGLPIEVKALQALKKSHESLSPVDIREAARALAERTIEEQKNGFKAWAVLGDWDNSYRTMDQDYILRQLKVFKKLVAKGLVNRELKPVYWSPSSGTALAEAELEYDEAYHSTAAFIRFPLAKAPDALKEMSDICTTQLGVLVWTTTPWTLPANQAVAVHKDLEYCVARLGRAPKSPFIVAKSRLEYVQSLLGNEPLDVLMESLAGSDIAGAAEYLNPLDPRQPKPVIHANFVTATSGSGLVHVAPGHGMDDYNICQPLGLPAWAPVDDKAKFTADVLPGSESKALKGKFVLSEGSETVLEYLRGLQSQTERFGQIVVASHPYTHKYPIDWRTKQPVIIRATEQWFADVERIKEGALQALDSVRFVPEASRRRLESFVRGRSQWCISRQRAWGVPIPAIYRLHGEEREALIDTSLIDHIIKVVKERGINAWWTDPEEDPAWLPHWLPEGSYVRGKDTLDVWFDSGTSWKLLDERPSGEPLADVYLEGSDQHRGWFQSSLLTRVASQQSGPAVGPFKTLITHGFTLDKDGRKMSKSLGNVISPDEIINATLLPPVKSKRQKGVSNSGVSYDALGPDALRLWVASSDYTRDVVIGQQVLQSVNQALHKYRVTCKWLLGALSDYDPNGLQHPESENRNQLIDSIALHQLSRVSQQTHHAYSNYDFSQAILAINRYVNSELSAFYFETLKDRLYTGSVSERLPAQQILHSIFTELQSMLTPIIPLFVEELWQHTPRQLQIEHPLQRVWTPLTTSMTEDERAQLEAQTDAIVAVHTAIKAAQETRRAEKKMGSSLECDAHILLTNEDSLPAHLNALFTPQMAEQLTNTFVVSRVFLHEGPDWSGWVPIDGADQAFEVEKGPRGLVRVTAPNGDKCGRCWRYLELNSHGLCGRCADVVASEFPELLQRTDV